MENDTFERFSAMDFMSNGINPEMEGGKNQLFDDFKKITAGKTTDLDVQLVASLRARHPELIVT